VEEPPSWQGSTATHPSSKIAVLERTQEAAR